MGESILIIEDDKIQRMLVKGILETFVAVDIHEAGNGDAAMAVLAETRVDVVLCDIGLPGKSGLDLAGEILDTYGHIAVIMLTADDDLATGQRAVELGACAYLVKPVTSSQLRISITTAVKIREYQNMISRQQAELEAKIAHLEKSRNDLEKSQEQFKALFENIQEGFYRAGMDGRLIMANPVVVSMMGYDAFEENTMSMIDLYRDPRDHEKLLKILMKKGRISAYEIETRKKDGSPGHILVNAHLRYTAEGAVAGIEGTIVDISDRKQLEQELSQAQKQESIGQLAAGIAHEINTPIQYVGDNTVFLQDSFEDLINLAAGCRRIMDALSAGSPDPDLVDEVMAAVETADLDFLAEEVPVAIKQSLDGVERVSKIVRSMKAFSHPGGESHEPADINALLKNTVTVARSEWRYVAELTMDLGDLPRVDCNCAEMNQVFLNLLINACHAVAQNPDPSGSGKGQIIIETRNREKEVEIRIKDTGAGIPESVRDRIFDPFFTT